MPWWWQPHPSPCGGAARGSSTNAARPAIPHSPAVLAGGTGLVGSEVCKRPASSAKVRAESHQASSNASSGGVSLTAVCDLTFGAVRGTTIRRTCGPRAASGTNLATGTTTSGFVVLGMWSGRRASLPHAGAGAVTAASGVRSPLPDRAPDAAGRTAASNTKAPPGPVVAKAKLGRGSETGSTEKNSSGFAAKGKRGKNQGNTSRAHRNPMLLYLSPGSIQRRYEARRIVELTYHEPPRRTRDFCESSYQSATHSQTFPARPAIPSGLEPRGKSPPGLIPPSFV